jgi:hypothetical protein
MPSDMASARQVTGNESPKAGKRLDEAAAEKETGVGSVGAAPAPAPTPSAESAEKPKAPSAEPTNSSSMPRAFAAGEQPRDAGENLKKKEQQQLAALEREKREEAQAEDASRQRLVERDYLLRKAHKLVELDEYARSAERSQAPARRAGTTNEPSGSNAYKPQAAGGAAPGKANADEAPAPKPLEPKAPSPEMKKSAPSADKSSSDADKSYGAAEKGGAKDGKDSELAPSKPAEAKPADPTEKRLDAPAAPPPAATVFADPGDASRSLVVLENGDAYWDASLAGRGRDRAGAGRSADSIAAVGTRALVKPDSPVEHELLLRILDAHLARNTNDIEWARRAVALERLIDSKAAAPTDLEKSAQPAKADRVNAK